MDRTRICRIVLAAALPVTLIGLGCSSNNTPTSTGGGGGSTDTTPPRLSSVSGIDQNHVEVTFDEVVTKESSERAKDYVILEAAPAPLASPDAGDPSRIETAPGDTLPIASAVLGPSGTTITLSTMNPMGNLPYDITVSGVMDLHGNKMTAAADTFTGTTTSDVTPPEITFRSPAPGASGVGTNESVVVQFSEPIDYGSLLPAVSWTHTGGFISFSFQQLEANTYVFTPLEALSTNTSYTFSIAATVRDPAGNTLAATSWSFTTTPTLDTTPPTFVSSSPGNGATNVATGANLRLTFSEAIDPAWEQQILLTPDVGDGILTWLGGGRTIQFDPDLPLLANTQYNLLIPPGGVRDLAGNVLQSPVTITFTTGSVFATGSFFGTIAGDPASADATDPAGTLVIAALDPPFSAGEGFSLGGSGAAGAGGAYQVGNLPDDVYYPFGILDSNGDGVIDPSTGDAIGVYGADIAVGDMTIDSLTITGGGAVGGIDFPLFDPSAISGIVIYRGTAFADSSHQLFVGAFDTTGFDTLTTLNPTFGTTAGYPDSPDFRLAQLEGSLLPGVYYVGAFLDGNDNGMLDMGVDPIGWYEVSGQKIPVDVQSGKDAVDVPVRVDDPPPALPSAARGAVPPVSWERPGWPEGQALLRWVTRVLIEEAGRP